MKGSKNNDAFRIKRGKVVPQQLRRRDLGGISSGMPIFIRAAVKPTPSISQNKKRKILLKWKMPSWKSKAGMTFASFPGLCRWLRQ